MLGEGDGRATRSTNARIEGLKTASSKLDQVEDVWNRWSLRRSGSPSAFMEN